MAEILTTLALRPGMHVIDRDDRRHAEHVVTGKAIRVDTGRYEVGLDGLPEVHGARHSWWDVTA